MSKDKYAQWLENHTEIKPYSIGRYSKAIDTISSELGSYGLPQFNLFSISDTSFIDTILDNPEFKKKDIKGHRMYSTTLKYFKRYIEYLIDQEFQTEFLKEELEYDKSVSSNIAKGTEKVDVVDKPQEKPNFRAVNNKKIWSRNPRYASEAVANADYLCEFDSEHKHFISQFNHKNYVEAHHLIPMKYQEEFDCSLDIHANIVSICLVCHKKIHYGIFQDKKEILYKLFNSRRGRLKAGGIDIDIAQSGLIKSAMELVEADALVHNIHSPRYRLESNCRNRYQFPATNCINP